MKHKLKPFGSLNLLLFSKHIRGKDMDQNTKQKKTIEVSARITQDLEDFMKTYADANGVKYMKGRIIVELAEMARKMILEESKGYKAKIENMVKQHKEAKLEKALNVLDALDEVGLELTQKKKKGSDET